MVLRLFNVVCDERWALFPIFQEVIIVIEEVRVHRTAQSLLLRERAHTNVREKYKLSYRII